MVKMGSIQRWGYALLALLLVVGVLLMRMGSQSASAVKAPASDTKQYRALTLSNGLSVMLIHDAKASMAAAAVNVAVGSWHNPVNWPGLAHLLEHVLILEPPVTGELRFDAQVQAQGGRSNAQTLAQHTQYYFSLAPEAFSTALQQFAQLLVAPALTEQQVMRERQAVQAEYLAGKDSESRRLQDVWRQLINPAHPASRFDVGNEHSLPEAGLHQALQQFYQRYYTAQNMTLAVYSDQPLDALQQQVTELFAALPSGESAHREAESVALLLPQSVPAVVQIKPHQDSRSVTLKFPLPAVDRASHQALALIAQVMGYEGAGSVLADLKEQGLATGLITAAPGASAYASTYDVHVQLTEQGLQHWPQVVERVLAYMQLLRKQGIAARIHTQAVQLAQFAFDYGDPADSMDQVRTLAQALHQYPAQQVLYAPYDWGVYDAALIQQQLQWLQADNLLVLVVDPAVQATQVSPQYQTPYRVSAPSADHLAQWRAAQAMPQMHLPEDNPFVAQSWAIKPVTKPHSELFRYHPEKLIDRPGLVLWHQQDDQFATAKSAYHILLQTPVPGASVQQQVHTQLLLMLIRDALNESLYQASMAQLQLQLYTSSQGVGLSLYGVDQSLQLLLDQVMAQLLQPQLLPQRFAVLKAQLRSQYRNQLDPRIRARLYAGLPQLLLAPYFSAEQRLQALEATELADLQTVQSTLFAHCSILALIQGNITAPQAMQLTGDIQTRLQAQQRYTPSLSVAQVPARPSVYYQPVDQDDSAVLLYYQAEQADYTHQALYALLGQLLAEPFFNAFRTEQQLGYVVQAHEFNLSSWPGLVFYLQSPTQDPALAQLYIQRFIAEQLSRLRQLPLQQFEQAKQGLIHQLTAPANHLLAQSQHNWQAILLQQEQFNHTQRLAQAIRQLSLTSLVQGYEAQLLGEHRHLLAVHGVSAGHQALYAQHRPSLGSAQQIESIAAFRAALSWQALP